MRNLLLMASLAAGCGMSQEAPQAQGNCSAGRSHTVVESDGTRITHITPGDCPRGERDEPERSLRLCLDPQTPGSSLETLSGATLKAVNTCLAKARDVDGCVSGALREKVDNCEEANVNFTRTLKCHRTENWKGD